MHDSFIRTALIIVSFTVLGLIYGCSSSTWGEAQEDDTYEAYAAYIEAHPGGEHVAEAKKRAENRYWNLAQADSTAKAYQKYLDQFPNGQYQSKAQAKINQLSSNKNKGSKAKVTGSNVIIRSDHTTESPSAGVVSKKGTLVQILDRFNVGNSKEAILKHGIAVVINGDQIDLPGGKAINILEDRNDSVRAVFSTPGYGSVEASISKSNIEAMSGEKWYKIHTTDGITGWIYGKFIKEL